MKAKCIHIDQMDLFLYFYILYDSAIYYFLMELFFLSSDTLDSLYFHVNM